ncbi:amidohydrolase family protein [Aegicerativicinus sediminis]|uniref:amidohydrolase family protein n=1 Tax=Aegicerativicinus sediminis TaxID=2893202 RepID=UPI001E55B659|nr:amidohydrolase family protein [Aegicerativicinus sediminis]
MKERKPHKIIDSHQHFWRYTPQTHGWISDELSVIRRDFLPDELESCFKENDVFGCIAVQADQTLEENEFLLDLANKHKFIKGVIGWVDFQNDRVEEDIYHFSEIELMKGFRHIVQGEADVKFLLRPGFLEGIKLLEKYDFVYEILVFPHQLQMVYEFVKMFPNVQFVLDHIAKPYIKEGYIEGWATMIKALGNFDNLSCKISGMVTEADYSNWSPEQIKPYIDVVLESFGPNRILYGSDWPVCLVAASYTEVLHLGKTMVHQLSPSEQDAFFYKNAKRIYNIN